MPTDTRIEQAFLMAALNIHAKFKFEKLIKNLDLTIGSSRSCNDPRSKVLFRIYYVPNLIFSKIFENLFSLKS